MCLSRLYKDLVVYFMSHCEVFWVFIRLSFLLCHHHHYYYYWLLLRWLGIKVTTLSVINRYINYFTLFFVFIIFCYLRYFIKSINIKMFRFFNDLIFYYYFLYFRLLFHGILIYHMQQPRYFLHLLARYFFYFNLYCLLFGPLTVIGCSVFFKI